MYTVTVTTKNQITIPMELSRKYNIHKGTQLLVGVTNGSISLTPAEKLVERLSGSIKKPENFDFDDLDGIISRTQKNILNNE